MRTNQYQTDQQSDPFPTLFVGHQNFDVNDTHQYNIKIIVSNFGKKSDLFTFF